MRYHALATDYDGTLASGGNVTEAAIESLKALRRSDRFIILVTGRILEDVQAAFEHYELCDMLVAENGAVLYDLARRESVVLAPHPPDELRRLLEARGIPLEVGRVILATREPHEQAMLDAVRELGLEMHVIFNKGAVMLLPSGVNKATGLQAALDRLKLSPHNVVGVGDAENDHAFLQLCECSVATANALESLKGHADLVLERRNGDGVADLSRRIVERDLDDLKLAHRSIPFAKTTMGDEVALDAYLPGTLLFAGTSGGGKSTAALALLERIIDAGYQTCIVDPEGDYESFGGAIVLGDASTIPTLDEVDDVLDLPDRSAIVNLLGVPPSDRPGYIGALLPKLYGCRARYGRPHWIVIDEAHHVLPRECDAAGLLPREFYGMLAITTDPGKLARALLDSVQTIVAFGEEPARSIEEAAGVTLHATQKLESSQALVWQSSGPQSVRVVHISPPESSKQRHRRKYAAGKLAPEKSFFFRGPRGKLNLRAANLTSFAQIAEGIDDETWAHHLARGDYERWFAEAIGDAELAQVARSAQARPAESRDRLLREIRERYTEPA